MSVCIRKVRHRVAGPHPQDSRLGITRCGERFLPGGTPRDWREHEPATVDCSECYR